MAYTLWMGARHLVWLVCPVCKFLRVACGVTFAKLLPSVLLSFLCPLQWLREWPSSFLWLCHLTDFSCTPNFTSVLQFLWSVTIYTEEDCRQKVEGCMAVAEYSLGNVANWSGSWSKPLWWFIFVSNVSGFRIASEIHLQVSLGGKTHSECGPGHHPISQGPGLNKKRKWAERLCYFSASLL